jgi:RNA polymerase sigma-70 factor (ECF subfamily)
MAVASPIRRTPTLSRPTPERDTPEPAPSEVAAAAQGDRRAWASLYAHYAPIIHSLLLLTVARGDADGLTHDVFLKAMLRLPELRDHRAFGAWLCQIARNEAVTWARRRQTARLRLAESGPQLPAPRAEQRTPPLDGERVLEHLRKLPEAYRETLALRLIAGLTGPQIASATGMTPASVRVNLCRGMAMLRESLGLDPPASNVREGAP